MPGPTQPTADDLVAMSFLSWAAYDSNGATAEDRLAGSGWLAFGPQTLGMNASQFEDGFYEVGGAAALVAYRNGVIAIALRGSEAWADPGDWGSAAFTQALHFNDLRPLILAVLSYIEGLPAGTIDQIYITGHSLGGAMAELTALDYGMRAVQTGANVSVATFGSPGTQSTSGGNALTDTIVHVGHQDDEIFNHTLFATGGFVRRGVDAVTIVIPDEDSAGVNNWNEHMPGLYERSLSLLAQSVFAQTYLGNASSRTIIVDAHDVEQFDPILSLNASLYPSAGGTIVVAADGNDQIYGTSRSDWIDAGDGGDSVFSYDGDDRLYGGDGDDVLAAGAGADFVDGGANTDTIVLVQSRSHYGVSVQGNVVVLTPLPGALQLGVTTVTNVENFQFADGIYTLAQLQPPADAVPPHLTLATPSDNASNVPRTSSIVLTFTENVFAGAGYVRIYRSDGVLHEQVATSDPSHAFFSGNVLVINPGADFQPGASYYVLVDVGAVRDQAGNAFADLTSSTALNFTVAAVLDTNAPVITALSPADNALSVGAGANIVITFNEAVTLGSGNLVIREGNGAVFRTISVNDASQVSLSGNTLTINPGVDLSFGRDYYVTLDAGAVRDLSNNPFGGLTSPSAFNFTTQSAPQTPPPQQHNIFLTVLDNSIRETNGATTTLTFGVVLSGAGAGLQPVSIQFATGDIPGGGSNATPGQDYIGTSGVLVIPAGEFSGVISVTVFGDLALESDEVFRLTLSQPSADVTLLTAFVTGSILNDDSAPNHLPRANIDVAITAPGAPIVIDVLANDTDIDGEPLSVSQLFNMSSGASYVLQPNGTVLFTPDPGVTGHLTFGYVLNDTHGPGANGFVNVLISGDGSAPVITSGAPSDETFTGGGGNDILFGGFGDDVFVGDGGADRLDGGPGFDYLDLRGGTGGALLQFRDRWAFNDGFGGQDILTNVEGVLGTQYNDVIDGSSATIQYITTGYRFYGNGGDDRLQSDAGNDVLDGGEGDDYLIYGAGADIIFGGDGDDLVESFNGSSDTLGDWIDGGAGDDILSLALSNSADVASGGHGRDRLSFGNGDVVSGGQGGDTFVFNGFSSGTVFTARIVDLAPGEEINWRFPNPVDIGGGQFAYFVGPITAGNGVSTGQCRVEYAVGAGATTLYFGFDANAGADFVLTLTGEFALSQLQVEQADGLGIRVRVQGGAGDDRIEGGSPLNNLHDGGAGIDTIDYSEMTQTVVVNLTAGTATGAEIGADQIAAVENVIGGSSNDTLIGNGLANTLDGGAGADAMTGGAGNDIYVVDNLTDVVTENASEGADTIRSTINIATLAANVENLILLASAANATGNALANIMTGNSAANILDGGLGADTMAAGDGDDTYVVDNAGDVTSETSALGGVDTVQTSVARTLGANLENLVLTGAGAINGFGNALANTITGNSAANQLNGFDGNDILNGGNGADNMFGGNGDDTYYVDNAGDQTTEGSALGGADIVYSSVSRNLTANIENLTLTGSANLTGSGNAINNIIVGNSGANTLYGFEGNDRLDGGTGADTLFGAAGDDVYVVDNAGDITVEGIAGPAGGIDTVETYISRNMNANFENMILVGSATIAYGNVLGNVLTGNALVNSLYGFEGNDTLDGGASADNMFGADGNDTYIVDNAGDVTSEVSALGGTDTVISSVERNLTANLENLILSGSANINGAGNGLNNIITGNSGVNTLFGLGGNDTLDGGLGADTLQGGANADTYAFTTALGGGNVDAIVGFSVADDTIYLNNDVFTGLATGALDAGAFVIGAAAADADDRIIYNSATGQLFFDADGNAGAAAILFATLAPSLSLTGADFIIGGP